VVVLAIAGPVALTRVVNHVAAWPGSERAGRSWALQGVLLLQFMALAHGFRGEWPDARARAEYPGLVERLRSLHGPVLAPGFGTLALQTGHAATFHPVALEALVEAKGNGLMTRDPDVLDRMLEPLAKGEERPTLVSDRRLDDPASSASPGWMESVRGYRLDSEWKELADSPAPRFVYVPISGAAPRPSPAPIAGAIESNPDSAHAQ
jgi:hypothetical protein